MSRLAGKLGVAIGVGQEAENLRVIEYVRQMMGHNMMAVVGTVRAAGYSQCYTCGFGKDCAVGSVVSGHGFLDAIKAEHLPPQFAEQQDAVFQAYKVGKTLGSILRARREQSP